MHKTGNLLQPGGKQWGGRRESPHPEHRGGKVAVVELTARAEAFPSPFHKPEEGRGEQRGHSYGRKFLTAEFGMIPETNRIDFLFRHKEQYPVTPVVK